MATEAHMSRKLSPHDQWLEENHPGLYFTLHALDGDRKALRWLEGNAAGLFHVCRAMTGEEEATAALRRIDPVERGLLVEILDDSSLLDRVGERHPDIHELFLAGKGDESARRRLKRKSAELAHLADVLHVLYQDGRADGAVNQAEDFGGGAAADVGLLVAEMHLNKGEYEKAVEAFSRALDSKPTADAYEGRARAFRALADEDERRATLLRAAVADA
jgi:hypothetical protein